MRRPPRRHSIAASSVAVALVVGACRLAPPAMPGKDLSAHAEEEATGRAIRAAEAEAGEAVRKAREAEDAAAAALRAAEGKADADAVAQQRDGERYAQAIAEARAGASGCTLEVERLIALRRQLAEYVSEPARDAAIAGLEPCRKAALKLRRKHHETALRDLPRKAAQDAVAAALRDEGLADPWVPVQSGALATPGRKDSSTAADEAALAKLRGDATAAAQAVDAAEADLERAKLGVAASDARLVQLDEADKAREEAWRGELRQSSGRYFAVAGAAGVAALVGLGVGFFYIGRGEAIESGKRMFPTRAERDEAAAHAKTGSLIGFVVALPFAVVGIVAAHYGLRRQAAATRIAATGNGLLIRF
ncbi:hypothetical protein [Nannocystis punicea]|uniref:Uncharacterized protein n=1 Tax=Nannocystis punicea TaxID=2995304 RepID=A0ABY7GUU6_9BACT|nr:hypothetical protein [Nannocystis poenicansa]WAS90665.1 hypothetical protein O0S08_31140 [Nannocystis poenicansa]